MKGLYQILFITFFTTCTSLPQKNSDEGRPYEFGFTIDGQQHRHEKKDDKGIVQGEFGFITADGIYHVTVYATDENGRFKILSMRNLRISAPLDGSPFKGEISPEANKYRKQANLAPLPPAQIAPNPLSIADVSPQQEVATTPKAAQPTKFTLQPTIKPACASCGYITTTKKPLPEAPPAQGSFYQNQVEQQQPFAPQSNLQSAPAPGAIPQYQPTSGPQTTNYNSGFQGNTQYTTGDNEPNQNTPNSGGGNPIIGGSNTGVHSSNPQYPSGGNYAGNNLEENQPLGGGNGGQISSSELVGGGDNANIGGVGNNPGIGSNNVVGDQPVHGGFEDAQIGGSGLVGGGNGASSFPLGNNPSSQGLGPSTGNRQSFPETDLPEANPLQIPGQGPGTELSTLPPVSIEGGVIHVGGDRKQDIPLRDKFPGMQDGLPEGIEEKDITDLLYKFHYTVGFHGHYEKGLKNGAKIGGYFVNGRDGISRVVTYIADENGYRPKVRFINIGLNSDDTPKPETEKTFGLKSFEFVWYPI